MIPEYEEQIMIELWYKILHFDEKLPNEYSATLLIDDEI